MTVSDRSAGERPDRPGVQLAQRLDPNTQPIGWSLTRQNSESSLSRQAGPRPQQRPIGPAATRPRQRHECWRTRQVTVHRTTGPTQWRRTHMGSGDVGGQVERGSVQDDRAQDRTAQRQTSPSPVSSHFRRARPALGVCWAACPAAPMVRAAVWGAVHYGLLSVATTERGVRYYFGAPESAAGDVEATQRLAARAPSR
jgi:hypothetical protein